MALLLDHAADVNKMKHDGATPLFMASQQGQLEAAQVLLDKGADIERGLNVGWSPLFVASWSGHAAVVAELLARGADRDRAVPTAHLGIPAGSTALSVAELKDHAEVPALLREHTAPA